MGLPHDSRGISLVFGKITSPADIKGYGPAERKALAQEMRDAMLRRASIHGGHFGPDFGAVEAIIALHTVFDSPRDKIVYDISHQSYPHKMLTGRVEAYIVESQYDEVSGYTNPEESPHDFFNVGHTSTSISLATGLAKARDLAGRKENIIAFIGDGSNVGRRSARGTEYGGRDELEPHRRYSTTTISPLQRTTAGCTARSRSCARQTVLRRTISSARWGWTTAMSRTATTRRHSSRRSPR